MITLMPGQNIQAYIDASASGEMIKFGKGRYPVSNLVLRPGRTYVSDGDATIVGTNDYATKPGGNDVVLRNLNFEGPALGNFDNLAFAGWQIDSCRFTLPKQGVGPKGIATGWASIGWTYKPSHLLVTNCLIEDIAEFTWLYAYGVNDVEVVDCTFRNRIDPANRRGMGRFIKYHGAGANANTFPEGAPNDSIGNSCRKFWVHRCTFANYRGMCVEAQDGSDGDVFEDLVCIDPVYFGTNPDDNLDVFGLSLVCARSRNMVVRRVYINSNDGGLKFRLGIELGGYNTQCTDCHLEGTMNASIAVNGSNGSGVVANNRIIRCPAPYNFNHATNQLVANGPATVLTWDTTRPYPGSSLGKPMPIPVPPAPIPEPPVPIFTLSVVPESADGMLSLRCSNVPAAATTIAFESVSTVGRESGPKVGPVGAFFTVVPSAPAFFLKGFHPGWKIDVRGVAKDAAGNTLDFTPWVTVQMPGDPTVPWPPPEPPAPIPTPTPAPSVRELLCTIKVFKDGSTESVKV